MQTYSPRIQDGISLVTVVAESKALKQFDSFSVEHLEQNHPWSAILDFSMINLWILASFLPDVEDRDKCESY